MAGPCNWPELPGCTCASNCLDSATPAQLEAATQYAEWILWAATGRRFGLCEITARPCGVAQGQCAPTWGWGATWSGGWWYPYIDQNGLWRNCGCRGFCKCAPKCEAYLPGPVNQVLAVMVDQELVPDDAYEIQNWHFLVRIDGGCWPECPELDVAGNFEVTYLMGEPVPSILLVAARTLACEFVKGCIGAECRLPGRLQFLTRQGVTAQFVDLERLMDRGLTGVVEVDQVIAALNPHALKERPRVWTPDRPSPRIVTSTGS